MIVELFRLNARLLRNRVFGSGRSGLRLVLEALLAVAVVVLLYVAAARLSAYDDALVSRVALVAGSALLLAVFLIPAIAARPELLDRRALRGYGFRPLVVALTTLPVALVGPLLPLLVALAILPLVVWSGRPIGVGEGILVTVLLGLQLTLSWRLGRALGGVLETRRRPRLILRVVAVVLLAITVGLVVLMILPRLIPLLGVDSTAFALDLISWTERRGLLQVDELLAATPLGAVWVAFAPTMLGAVPIFDRTILIGAATILGQLVLWVLVVRGEMRPTRRIVPVRERSAPTAFRGVGSSALGAVAARSTVYWLRDPRYRVVFFILPIIPVVVFLAAWVGGIPLTLAALIPLPLILLLVGWSTLHNDVAYDSTAVWTLLATQLDGRSDRLGRAAPVLAVGTVLLLVGVPLTVWAHGDIAIAPLVVGLNLVVFLGAVGVASVASVRSPYPAPRPGDSAFQQPVVAGVTGVGAQAGSLLMILLQASPVFIVLALHLLGVPGQWSWLGLVLGAGIGVGTLVVGIAQGARDFDHGAPELLAYTMRN